MFGMFFVIHDYFVETSIRYLNFFANFSILKKVEILDWI